ncbi:uncharacterized protein TNCV_1634981 [Trichonephila clavipes]|nr:uncharacterized protein TNCV_1634981 [Trichonephila clavipes]
MFFQGKRAQILECRGLETSDESRFRILNAYVRLRIWRQVDEAIDPACQKLVVESMPCRVSRYQDHMRPNSLLGRLLYLVGIKVTDYAEAKKKNNSEERKAKNVKLSLTCSFIRDFFKWLLIQMHGAVSTNELKKMHYIYEGIMKMLNDMDSEFSLLAFIAVLFNTFGLFWDVYRIAFYENETSGYLLFTLSAISYLALLLMLMISGFASNEQANIVKIHMLCLPHENAENQYKMNFNKILLQDNVLTLWKIYVWDRSLVIATFGTLLTYGIMLGTLGKYD